MSSVGVFVVVEIMRWRSCAVQACAKKICSHCQKMLFHKFVWLILLKYTSNDSTAAATTTITYTKQKILFLTH